MRLRPFRRGAPAAALAGVLALPALAGRNAAAVLHVDADWRTPASESSAPVDAPLFKLAVRITGAQYLDGYAFELGYDTALVAFVKAEAGSAADGLPNFLETRGGSAVAFVGKLSGRDTARITVGNALAGADSARSPSGDGLLALLEFRVKGTGTARFFPGKAELLDWRQQLDTAAEFRDGSVDLRATASLRVRGRPSGSTLAWVDPLGRRLGAGSAPGLRIATTRAPSRP